MENLHPLTSFGLAALVVAFTAILIILNPFRSASSEVDPNERAMAQAVREFNLELETRHFPGALATAEDCILEPFDLNRNDNILVECIRHLTPSIGLHAQYYFRPDGAPDYASVRTGRITQETN